MMKPKKRSKMGPSTVRELAHAQTEIMKSPDIMRTLSNLRQVTPANLYSDMVQLALSLARHRDTISSSAFPRSILMLRSLPPLQPIGMEREFRWFGGYIPLFSQALSRYIALSCEFEKVLLKGKYSDSEKILNQIEEEFGFSIWLIKNRIALLQLSKGLESQKKYTADIRQQALERGILPFIAHFESQLAEPLVTPELFTQEFTEILSNVRIPDWVKAYLRYHITLDRTKSPDEIASILRYESTNSVIDYYEAILEMSRIIIATEQTSLFPVLLKTLSQIQNSISDSRINMLIHSLDGTNVPHVRFDSLAVKAFDNYLRGNYKEALSLSRDRLFNQPSDTNTIEIAARSICALNEAGNENGQSLLMTLIYKISSIIRKGDDSDKDARDLHKIACIFSHSSWSKSIFALLIKEMSPLLKNSSPELMRYCALSSTDHHPLNVSLLNNESAISNSISLLEQTLGSDSLPVSYCIKSCGLQDKQPDLDKMVWEERSLLDANLYLLNNNFERALSTAKKLSESRYDYYHNKAIQIISFCLFALQELSECINYAVQAYLQNHNLQPILPIAQIVATIDHNARKNLSPNIALPVIYDIYTKYIGNEYERLRNYAYEDFLYAHDMRKPSELRARIDSFQKEMLIYYLRYICMESVMDCSIIYEGSQDIARERIEVCSLLSDLDNQNVDVYQNEIKDIHRRLMIKKKMREIEQSKIYVDIEGLEDIANRNLKEQFSRYHLFIRDGIDFENIELRQQAIETLSAGDFQKVLALSLPQNEMNDLFQSIIVNLRDYFTSNTQHGLDAYLSVRIRHGTFTGQLRSPIEARNLITQRDSTTGEYKPNAYWIDKLHIHNPGLIKSITECFLSFSKDFDNLIHEMVTDWIQVSTKKEDKGLFNFILYKPEIVHLATLVTTNSTFDDFLNHVFDYFFSKLETSLQNVREKIRTEAKEKCNNLITNLETEIINVVDNSIDIGELLSAIGITRTELQISFDRVIEWFHLAQETREEPYSIEDVISISVDSMRISNPEFSADISISEEMKDLMIKGNITSFVDVLFIIFGNIVKHSHISGAPQVIVEVDKREDYIVLKVLNEIADGVNNKEARKRIKDIKEAMEEGRYDHSIITEGGTGFHKIRKILLHDFTTLKANVEPTLDFGFTDKTHFYVDLRIPILKYMSIEEITS